jgi:hypothetical protein
VSFPRRPVDSKESISLNSRDLSQESIELNQGSIIARASKSCPVPRLSQARTVEKE